jgi:peptide/nickel transport system substrate-binding protein
VRPGIFRAIVAALLLVSLTQAGSATTLRWTRAADALTLDPHAQNDGVTHAILNHIYESLLWRDAAGKLIPRLATQWHLKADDPTIWIFKLREGVKFHNGEDFTAEDVVFTLDRARSHKSSLRQLHADVVKVTAPDAYTVAVKLRAPNPIYPNNLTGTYILDRGWAEAHGVKEVQDIASGIENYAVRNANGTGAYVLKSREVGVRTVLEASGNHWAETKPEVSEIVYTPIADNATRVAALLSGEVDFLHEVPVQDIERLKKTPGIKVSTGPENRSVFLGYRVDAAPLASSDIKDRNPLSDVRVREAFELAIDRDAIRTVVLRGNSVPTGIIVPPFVHGWTPQLDAYAKPDAEKAKALLSQAGYPDGFTITLDTPNNRYINDEAIAQAVVGFLGRIGVKVRLASRPYAQHSPLLIDQKSDFYLFGWGVPTFDSAYNFNDLVHTREGRYGAYNATGYSNATVDSKIESLGAETDLQKRDATINELWTLVKAEHLYLPLHNQIGAWAVRDRFNLEHQPDNSPKIGQATVNN